MLRAVVDVPRPPGGPVVDDAWLVAAVTDGSHAALGEIYRRHSGVVWALAERVCRDPHLAEEVCQNVFTELWSAPGRFDPARGTFRSWLLAQSHSRAVDVLRAEAAHRRRDEREARLAAPSAADVETVETTVQRLALTDSVQRAVDRLSDDEREPILLTYFGGHSYRSAAALLGQPEGTVKSRIRAGLKHLRRALEAQGVTP